VNISSYTEPKYFVTASVFRGSKVTIFGHWFTTFFGKSLRNATNLMNKTFCRGATFLIFRAMDLPPDEYFLCTPQRSTAMKRPCNIDLHSAARRLLCPSKVGQPRIKTGCSAKPNTLIKVKIAPARKQSGGYLAAESQKSYLLKRVLRGVESSIPCKPLKLDNRCLISRK
jgi:hypothetical protein